MAKGFSIVLKAQSSAKHPARSNTIRKNDGIPMYRPYDQVTNLRISSRNSVGVCPVFFLNTRVK